MFIFSILFLLCFEFYLLRCRLLILNQNHNLLTLKPQPKISFITLTTGENFVNMRSTPLQVYTNNVSCKTECANIAEDFVTYEARLLSLNQKTEDFKTFWKSSSQPFYHKLLTRVITKEDLDGLHL